MELFPDTLASWLRCLTPDQARKIPEHWLLEWIRGAAIALSAVHDLGFAHLDVKPDNLFLRPAASASAAAGYGGLPPVLLLGDFGSALQLSEHEGESTTGRTDERYICPERRVSMAADVFSLGATLLDVLLDVEMPTGGRVWGDIRTTRFSAARAVLERNRDAPQSVVELVDAMMRHNPADRPTLEDIVRQISGISPNKRARSPPTVMEQMDCEGGGSGPGAMECTVLYSNNGGGDDGDEEAVSAMPAKQEVAHQRLSGIVPQRLDFESLSPPDET